MRALSPSRFGFAVAFLMLTGAGPGFGQPEVETWTVWPQASAELLAEVRTTAADFVSLSPRADAETTLAQATELDVLCEFKDDPCLRELMKLANITHMVWVREAKAGLELVAFATDRTQRLSGPAEMLESLLAQALAPERYFGTLVVRATPPETELSLRLLGDTGETKSIKAKTKLRLPPGEYEVLGSHPGFVAGRLKTRVSFNQRALAKLTLQPVPELPPPESGMSSLGVTGAVLLSTAALTSAGSLAFGLVMDGQLDPSLEEDEQLFYESASMGGYIGAASTGVIAALGGLLLTVDLLSE